MIVISLAASSLPYASLCVRSLAENLDGDEAIHLLTDTPGDQEQLQQAALKSLQGIPGLEGLPGLVPPQHK